MTEAKYNLSANAELIVAPDEHSGHQNIVPKSGELSQFELNERASKGQITFLKDSLSKNDRKLLWSDDKYELTPNDMKRKVRIWLKDNTETAD